MKIVNIIGLVLIIVAFAVIGYYVEEVSSARMSYWNSYDWGNYNYFSSASYSTITTEAALVMVPFTIFFILAYIWNIIKVKTTSTKVLSIIGLSFSLLIVLINLLVLAEPGSASFDESGGFFIIYHIINLAFFIVLLVQSVKYENRKGQTQDTYSDIIDTEIV